ncbi:MAG: hypothetical protein ABWY25_07480 [Paenisporosarcina sp.]
MDEDSRTERMLQSTDDATLWATEFCRLFDGRVVTMADSEDQVDQGLMVGWFSNAMQAGINQYERQRSRAADELKNIFEGGSSDV